MSWPGCANPACSLSTMWRSFMPSTASSLARRSPVVAFASRYYLETRGDVLVRDQDVFRFWRKLGLKIMFIGLEAVDEDGLRRFRKRVGMEANFEALEIARSLDISVAINIIADPSWDRARFEAVRRWCLEIPEVVNISVTTPYPGTEICQNEQRRLTTRDYPAGTAEKPKAGAKAGPKTGAKTGEVVTLDTFRKK